MTLTEYRLIINGINEMKENPAGQTRYQNALLNGYLGEVDMASETFGLPV